MVTSVRSLAFRQIRTKRLRAALTSFGIVLGVGMVFGVLLLSGTIRKTFDDVINSAWGSRDVIVLSYGGVLPSDRLDQIRATPGVKDASAMVGGTLVRLDADGKPITGAKGRLNIAGYDTAGSPPYDFEWTQGRAPEQGLEIGVDKAWAHDHGVDVGEIIRLGAADGPESVTVVGIFTFANGLSMGSEAWAAMPEGPARRMFDQPEGWHQIAVTATDRGDIPALRKRLEDRLGSGVTVKTPEGVSEDIGSQLDALNVVLYFFAAVALFVGGFLILNSFQMTVAQRMRELGMLRTLGAPRAMLRRSVMTEAVLLGVIGSALGLVLGLGLAIGLIALIRGLGIPVGSVDVTPSAAIISVMLGLVATTAGAWWPARRAARVSPIAAAQGAGVTRTRPSRRRIIIGALLYVPGAIFGGQFWFSNAAGGTGSTLLGISMTMAMFVGMALSAPAIIMPLVRLLSVPLRRFAPTGGRLASDAARRNPSRTAATAIALTIGLSVIVVNASVSASFIDSIHDQINRSFASDVTVKPLGADVTSGRTVSAGAISAVKELPDAGVVSPLHVVVAELPGLENAKSSYGMVEGVDPATIGKVDRPEVDGIAEADIPAALARGEAIIGRGYADQLGVGVGDRFRLDGPGGATRLRVAGIYDVYNQFGGNNVRISIARLHDLYGPGGPSELLIAARSPDRRAALAQSVQRLIDREHPELEAQSAADVKQEIDDQINQQFALFNAILAIAVAVSLLGVINTLAMSVVERTREIGVLRALGSSRWLVRLTMVHESLLITIAGSLAGLLLGGVIAWMWVLGLDSQIPGITFHMPLTTIVAIAVAAVVLGLLASVMPARRAARLDVVDALAYE